MKKISFVKFSVIFTLIILSTGLLAQMVPFGFFRAAITAINITFDYIGAKASTSAGYITNGTFSASISQGSFNYPNGVEIDVAGDRMYVMDVSNGRIQKLVLSTGAFVGAIGNSTAAGTCVAGKQNGWCTGGFFSQGTGDGMFTSGASWIKIDLTSDALFVADGFRIQKFVLSTGAFVGAIGNSSASGTCVAGKQNSWCTGGSFNAGSGDGMFAATGDIEIDTTKDHLFVSDYLTFKIQKFVLSTGAFVGAIGVSTASGTCTAGKQTSWCTNGVFSQSPLDGGFFRPLGLAVDTTNDYLIVVDSFNYRIQRFVLSSGAYSGSIGGSSTSGTCVAGKQTNWCTGGNFGFGHTDGYFWGPADVEIDVTGNLMYIADSNNHRIAKFTLSTGAFVGSIGYSSDAAGTCVVGAQSGWCSGMNSFSMSNFATDGLFNYPQGIALDTTNNRLYVADSLNNRIKKFNLGTGAFIGAAGGSTYSLIAPWANYNVNGPSSSSSLNGAFNTPRSVVADTTNNHLYVADNYRVQKYTLSTGAYLGSIGRSSASGTCIAGKQNGWCTGGSFSSGTSDGQFGSQLFLAIDSLNDHLYVADNTRIQKFVLSTGAFVGAVGKSTASGTCVAGSQTAWCTGGVYSSGASDGNFNGISEIALDVTNNALFVTDNSNHRLQKLNLSTGAFVGAIGNSTASGTCVAGKQNGWCTGGSFSLSFDDGGFYSPKGIAIDVANNSLFVSSSGNKIQKFVLSTGAFIGSIGTTSSASGTCILGKQNGWCTGGTFTTSTTDGGFTNLSALEIGGGYIYVGETGRVQKFNSVTGAFVGAIGYSSASGTCLAGVQSTWCTGGSYLNSLVNGGFSMINDLFYTSGKIFAAEGNRIQRMSF